MSSSLGIIVVLSGILAADPPMQRPTGGLPPSATAADAAEVGATPAESGPEGVEPEPTEPEPTGRGGPLTPPEPAEPDPAEPEPAPDPAAPEPVPAPVIDLEAEYAASTDVFELHDRKIRRSQAALGGGAVLAIAGLVMLIGAATEAAKPDCKFGLDTCRNAPRPRVARGLGVGAGIALAGGGSLVAWGLVRRHRLRTSVVGSGDSVAVTLRGRF